MAGYGSGGYEYEQQATPGISDQGYATPDSGYSQGQEYAYDAGYAQEYGSTADGYDHGYGAESYTQQPGYTEQYDTSSGYELSGPAMEHEQNVSAPTASNGTQGATPSGKSTGSASKNSPSKPRSSSQSSGSRRSSGSSRSRRSSSSTGTGSKRSSASKGSGSRSGRSGSKSRQSSRSKDRSASGSRRLSSGSAGSRPSSGSRRSSSKSSGSKRSGSSGSKSRSHRPSSSNKGGSTRSESSRRSGSRRTSSSKKSGSTRSESSRRSGSRRSSSRSGGSKRSKSSGGTGSGRSTGSRSSGSRRSTGSRRSSSSKRSGSRRSSSTSSHKPRTSSSTSTGEQRSRSYPRRNDADQVFASSSTADKQVVWEIFSLVDADDTGNIDSVQLQNALSNGTWTPFNIETVNMMIGMFDKDGDRLISFKEFGALWKYVNDWQEAFNRFDLSKSGNIDEAELKQALCSFGYNLSDMFHGMLMTQFDRTRKGRLNFDDFIKLCLVLQTGTSTFRENDKHKKGSINVNYEEFLSMVVNLVQRLSGAQ